MWMTMWLACGPASVESNQIATKPMEHSPEKTVKEPPDKPVVQPSKPLVKGALFFAKLPDCVSECIAEVTRMVPEWNPQVALDALYAGPSKKDGNVRLLACESTGAKVTSIEKGVARVDLQGGCGGCGTVSVYDLILPTLKAFPEINVVQVYDPSGKSQIEGPKTDSRPACLEP